MRWGTVVLMVKTEMIKEHPRTLDFQVDILAVWPKGVELSAYDIYNRLVAKEKFQEFRKENNAKWREFYTRIIGNFKALKIKGDISFVRKEEGKGPWPKSLYKRVK